MNKNVLAPFLYLVMMIMALVVVALAAQKAYAKDVSKEPQIIIKCGSLKGIGELIVMDGDDVQTQQFSCGANI